MNTCENFHLSRRASARKFVRAKISTNKVGKSSSAVGTKRPFKVMKKYLTNKQDANAYVDSFA